MWEEIVATKAKLRSLSNLKNNPVDMEQSPYREEGFTRDIIADKVRMGSGRTYERAKNIVSLD